MSAERQLPDSSSFSPLDRATVPEAVEQNTESAWAKFEALQRGEAPEPTQPGRLADLQAKRGYETTQPQEPGPRATAAPQAAPRQEAGHSQPQAPMALADVMVVARRNNRACPRPAAWAAFHKQLPIRELHGRQLGAPLPITGTAWTSASPMDKRLRLRDQIEWAERTGALAAAHAFLAALPEEQWLHFSD